MAAGLMSSLGVEEAGGEEEDAGKEGGMDGDSGEPLSCEGRSVYYCGCGLLVEISCMAVQRTFG